MTQPTTASHITVAFPNLQIAELPHANEPIPHDELCDRIAEGSLAIAAQLRGNPTTNMIINGHPFHIYGEFRQLRADGRWYEIDSDLFHRRGIECLYRQHQGVDPDAAAAFRPCGRCPSCQYANEHNRVRHIVEMIDAEIDETSARNQNVALTVDRLLRDITPEGEPLDTDHQDLVDQLNTALASLRHAHRITRLMVHEAGDEK